MPHSPTPRRPPWFAPILGIAAAVFLVAAAAVFTYNLAVQDATSASDVCPG